MAKRVFKKSIRLFWQKKACFAIDLLVKQARKSSGDWIRTNDLRVMSDYLTSVILIFPLCQDHNGLKALSEYRYLFLLPGKKQN